MPAFPPYTWEGAQNLLHILPNLIYTTLIYLYERFKIFSGDDFTAFRTYQYLL